jgi:hypothetical protein
MRDTKSIPGTGGRVLLGASLPSTGDGKFSVETLLGEFRIPTIITVNNNVENV